MTQPADILRFWFGSDRLNAPVDDAHRQLWFSAQEELDQQIEENFGHLVEAALGGELEGWRTSLAGELALVLLCDQFTRNIYRDTRRAFAGDALARKVALEVIERGDDEQLGLYQRAFLGMPLEHDESLEMQQRSVEFFDRLRKSHLDGAEGAAQAENFYQYALAHREVIEEFGRYPHRNAALGRASTPAEQAWLEKGGGF
ncbi:DUF924 family protein [Microbulbifer yueqingensis]|uniref:Uncharacterized conserved protein, DUF924 family n=1 Tax=Microbulbifer yueqingensis TaxID=658219 RepID=A0A1G8Z8D1_9GAMM|nr:DUF924 family protein [Microbulbifer yueqingensis]SDK11311.1 Uncharacterized conserved protein, DUF924 family [Microbulbifer yueqingensis]